MPSPRENATEFRAHPVDAVAALLPDKAHAEHAVDALRAAGVDVAEVEVLHGPEGIAILDQNGTGHGRRAHLVRLLQKWTYYEQTLSLYTTGMRHGGTLVVVPATEDRGADLAALLVPHGARAVHYFGLDRVEELSGA
jgi:hypothetical protein